MNIVKKICFWIGVFVFSFGAFMLLASLAVAPMYIIYRIRDGTFSVASVFEGFGLWLFSDIVSSVIAMFGWLFAMELGH